MKLVTIISNIHSSTHPGIFVTSLVGILRVPSVSETFFYSCVFESDPWNFEWIFSAFLKDIRTDIQCLLFKLEKLPYHSTLNMSGICGLLFLKKDNNN